MHRVLPSCLAGWMLLVSLGTAAESSTLAPLESRVAPPVFRAAGDGEFVFDTGLLRGKLRPGGKSLGLASVVYVPSGRRLDRSNGLLSHYRVFTKGARYGTGAWDWPSQAVLGADGSVEVRWAPAEGRPFRMQAVYRWRDPATLDLETSVEAEKALNGFESFLACYFTEPFTNAAAFVGDSPEASDQPGFLPARESYGAWLMFPRDAAIRALINDGRWNLEPNPVSWTLMPALAQPIVWRRDPASELTAVLMSPATDCFAIASPHQTEGHYSVYLSLFGQDLAPAQVVRARVRLTIARAISDREILRLYQKYLDEVR